MSHAIKTGAVDQIAVFRAFGDDGTAKTDLTASTTGLSLTVFRIGATAVSISSLSDKAADNTTHADGAIRQISGNLYTVDLPDAACASQVPSITVKGSYTGGVIEGVPHPLVGYDGTAAAVGANTTAPATPTNVSDAQAAILAKLPAALVGGRLDVSVGAMAADVLTAAALAADAGAELAALVESYIVNEGDATAVLQAVADKIAADWVAGDASPLAIVAAIKADATLATLISRVDATISSRNAIAPATPTNVSDAQTAILADFATKLSAARLQVLDDWINDGRLDTILDAAAASAATAATSAGTASTAATLAKQILGNKVNVTDNGNGTYDLAFRNDGDSADVLTVRYTPATGARTVV